MIGIQGKGNKTDQQSSPSQPGSRTSPDFGESKKIYFFFVDGRCYLLLFGWWCAAAHARIEWRGEEEGLSVVRRPGWLTEVVADGYAHTHLSWWDVDNNNVATAAQWQRRHDTDRQERSNSIHIHRCLISIYLLMKSRSAPADFLNRENGSRGILSGSSAKSTSCLFDCSDVALYHEGRTFSHVACPLFFKKDEGCRRWEGETQSHSSKSTPASSRIMKRGKKKSNFYYVQVREWDPAPLPSFTRPNCPE